MKTKLQYFLLLPLFAFGIASCSDDNEALVQESNFAIENISGETSIAQSDTIYLKAKGDFDSKANFQWFVNGKEVATSAEFKFVADAVGAYKVELAVNKGVKKSALSFDVFGKFRDGVFVLNEGNMSSENGSLIFISPKGQVTDSAYYKVNGTFLGNVSQDLFIANGKIYIISQNGSKSAMGGSFDNDGMLVVANAETLEKVTSYDEELNKTLSWPSHLSVIDNEIFIRDNKGVYLFDETSKKLTYIEGSKGASKMPMAVVAGKVFVPAGKSVLVLEKGKTEVAQKIDFSNTVSAVVKSHDGKLWVSSSSSKAGAIAKIDAKTYSVIKENILPMKVTASYAASAGISAKQDTIYFSNLTTTIYRHVFASNETKEMVDAKTLVSEDTGMVYNTIAVHPTTGNVYMNTIKGFGWDFLKNNISVFDFKGAKPKLVENYKHHTHFPAGVFFTDNFK